MPASPDARTAAPVRALKTSAAVSSTNGSTLGKSASESSIRKKQQGSLLAQELLQLERDDGKRHARELSACLLEYAKEIEGLHEKNRRLEEELAFDDNVARDDPFVNEHVAEKLSNLYLQGNNVMIRLELEKKEIARLNALIQRHESALAQQKTKLYELAALDQNHATLIGRVRKLENDIDRRIVKMNERLHTNRKLREAIDAHRAERVRMDAIYSKTATEALSKRNKVARATTEVAKLRHEIAAVEEQIDAIRQEGEVWEAQCDQRAAQLLQELKEIALHQRDVDDVVDVETHPYLGENDIVRNLIAAQDTATRARATRSRWKTGQAKIATDVLLTRYQENRTIIEKIHEVSGTKTHVNQLAEDIENHRQVSAKLREEIGKLKQRKDSIDFQRNHRIEGLKSRLQFTIEQKKHKEEANHQLQEFLAALKPSILLLHARIGCPESHNDSDMKKVLGEIEEQIVTVLQKFHLKNAAKVLEESLKDSSSAGATSSAGTARLATPSSAKTRAESAVVAVGSTAAPLDDSSALQAGGAATSALSTTTTASTAVAPLALVESSASARAGDARSTVEALKTATAKAVAVLVAKDQPYRYTGLRPPHLSTEDLKKRDNVEEEEYPLTYDELKVKVWHTDATASSTSQQ